MGPDKGPTNDWANIKIDVFIKIVSKDEVISPSQGPQVTAG